MAAPMPFRQFKELLKEHKCTYEQKKVGTHYFIYDEEGQFVSDFCIKHGKNTKGEEVLPCYVSEFRRAIKGKS